MPLKCLELKKDRNQPHPKFKKKTLEGTARYACFTSSSCGGLQSPAKAIFALLVKTGVFMLFWLTLGHFWCSVVTSVTFSSNLSHLKQIKKSKKIQKNPKNIPRTQKNQLKPKKFGKCQKMSKNPKILNNLKKSKQITFFQQKY